MDGYCTLHGMLKCRACFHALIGSESQSGFRARRFFRLPRVSSGDDQKFPVMSSAQLQCLGLDMVHSIRKRTDDGNLPVSLFPLQSENLFFRSLYRGLFVHGEYGRVPSITLVSKYPLVIVDIVCSFVGSYHYDNWDYFGICGLFGIVPELPGCIRNCLSMATATHPVYTDGEQGWLKLDRVPIRYIRKNKLLGPRGGVQVYDHKDVSTYTDFILGDLKSMRSSLCISFSICALERPGASIFGSGLFIAFLSFRPRAGARLLNSLRSLPTDMILLIDTFVCIRRELKIAIEHGFQEPSSMLCRGR